MRSARRCSSFRRAYTLVEVLVVICILVILAVIGFRLGARSLDRTRQVVDLGQLRTLNNALLARGMENNGILYTKQETGNSNYREWRDPMSLCQILIDYIPDEKSWLGPGSIARHRKSMNSYAWSQAEAVRYDTETGTGYRMGMAEEEGKKANSPYTIWNNAHFALPSGYNRPDSLKVGPGSSPKNLHHFPWDNRRKMHWFRMDGSVDLK